MSLPSMHSEAWTEHALFEALDREGQSAPDVPDSLVVASTVRAALLLRRRYGRWKQSHGHTSWSTPRILAWDAWLNTLYQAAMMEGAETRLLLTTAQEQELWRNVIAGDLAAQRVLSPTALSEVAHRAWCDMNDYCIQLARLRLDDSEDTQAFWRWANEFQKLCRQRSFLSPSQLSAAILLYLQESRNVLPGRIVLVGFDRMTPSQGHLIETLRAQCAVTQVELTHLQPRNFEPCILYSETVEQEIEAAAHWIRKELMRDPAQRIAVLVPSLDKLRDPIDAIFRRVLAPRSFDLTAPSAPLPYEFSLGVPLHRLHPIRTARLLLRWVCGRLTMEEVSWLIANGDFSRASKYPRARVDRKFRKDDSLLGGGIAAEGFRQWLSRYCPGEELAPLRAAVQWLATASKKHSPDRPRPIAEWREAIEQLLADVDWGLLCSSDSAGRQLLARWEKLLDQLTSLGAVAEPVTFSEAVDRLESAMESTLFALETRDAQVQVVGLAESAGLLFDSVWFLNANSAAWPPAGKVRAFLPWNLQREARMPYADPAEDYAFARNTTRRALSSGRNVICSFSLQQTDPETASARKPAPELAVSPVLAEELPSAPIMPAAEFLPELARLKDAAEHPTMEAGIVHDEAAVTFTGSSVAGGVSFLKLQAACPFRAFAELRLGAAPLQGPVIGLSPAAQGSIIHKVLQGFWQEYGSQEHLLESSIDQRRTSLRKHIDEALERFRPNNPLAWQRELLETEAQRIEERLLAWLAYEETRTPFRVEQLEHTLRAQQLGGVSFDCRVDRVDWIGDGQVIIDYKTGQVRASACEGERPDQPQLPAYAVLHDHAAQPGEPLAGIAFARIHAQDVSLQAVSTRVELGGLGNAKLTNPEDLHRRIREWDNVLTTLANDFRSGLADVDPKNAAQTCRLCEQSLLCRIQEAGFAGGDNSLEESGDEDF